MFEQLREKFGHKPEIQPPDEQIVSRIDGCVQDHQSLIDALAKFAEGEIFLEELKFFQDCLGTTQYSLGKQLKEWGLWEKYEGADYPTIEDMIAIRETLIPNEENPQNVANIEDYRRI